MRQEELHAFLPWESEAGMVARNAKAVNLPPLPRALMSSLYGKGDKGEEDKRELDLDVNLFSLAKEGRGEGKSEDGEAEFVRMPGGESILRVKQILKMWRMRQLLKAWMRWYKFSFTGSSAGTDGGMVSGMRMGCNPRQRKRRGGYRQPRGSNSTSSCGLLRPF